MDGWMDGWMDPYSNNIYSPVNVIVNGPFGTFIEFHNYIVDIYSAEKLEVNNTININVNNPVDIDCTTKL
jgi:hypothetical protein